VRGVAIGIFLAVCTTAVAVLGVLPLRGSESERVAARRRLAIIALYVMVMLAGFWQAREEDAREALRDRQIGVLIMKAQVACNEVARTYGDAAAVNVGCELGQARADGKASARGTLTVTPPAR
jgi:hypothetical protein